MNLIHLFYSSVPAIPMGSKELIEILESARAKNDRDGITGMLAFSGTAFLQVLEGEAGAVNQTFARIRVDKRHGEVHMIGIRYPAVRQFPSWSMGFAGFKSFRRELVEKYSSTGELHDRALRTDDACALLIELARQEARPGVALAVVGESMADPKSVSHAN